jgi:biotin carboxylase
MAKRRKLLVLGAAASNVETLRALARVSGIDLVVFDANPASPGHAIARTFATVDIADARAVFAAAETLRIDGVYPMNDHGVRAAAYVAGRLGLRGPSMAAAHAALDKGVMREVWQSWGLQQPQFRVVTSLSEVRAFAREVGLPAVVKPVDCGGGGRGVYVLRDMAAVARGFRAASGFLKRNNRLIVEQFVEGTETSVEVARCSGRTTLIAYSDKYKPPTHSSVATRIAYPGRFPQRVVSEITRTADQALQAVGVSEGVGHVELIVAPDESVWLVEMGARVGGGHTFHPIASHVSGLNYPEWVARHFVGDSCVPRVGRYRGAAYYFFSSERAGTLQAIEGLDAARNVPGVVVIEAWKAPGQRVAGLDNSMERLGCVVALGDTRADAHAAAERAMAAVRFVVEPAGGGAVRQRRHA